jgi:triacylglycerol lipase
MVIVLMHGVLGFGSVAPSLPQYFNGVAEHLQRELGARVLTTAVAPIGRVELRASRAAAQIAQALVSQDLDRTRSVHIIAHSMGGLDARFLISKNLSDLRDRIATLVCVGTPHFGSPVATLLDRLNPSGLLPGLSALHPIVEFLRQHTDAVRDLSEEAAPAFNQACTDVATVRYLNIAGVGRRPDGSTSRFFQPIARLLAVSGHSPSDGIVPFASATRGGQPFEEWAGDHADLVGHDLDRPLHDPAENHLARFVALVRRL